MDMDAHKEIWIYTRIIRSRPNLSCGKIQARRELLRTIMEEPHHKQQKISSGHSLGGGQCPVFLGDFAGGMAARCAWHAGVPQARLGRLAGKWLRLGTKGAVCRGNIFSRFVEATPAKFGAKWSRDCDHFGKKGSWLRILASFIFM